MSGFKRNPNVLQGRPCKISRKSIGSGRKRKNISNASEKTFYRRAEEIARLCNNDVSLLELALKIAQKKCTTSEYNEEKHDENFQHTADSALAFYLEYDYSAYQYKALVADCKSRKIFIYPPYFQIDVAKKRCLIDLQQKSESEIAVNLQNILNKTVESLCNSVAENWNEHGLLNLILMTTLGFDSSAGHLDPPQKSKNLSDHITTAQQSLFVSCFNIIQICSF